MVILTRLLPWILFGIGQALIGPSGAASLAAAGALLLIALSLKTGHRLSELILDSAVLMYFLGFAVLSVLAPRSSAVRYVAAGAQLFQGAVVLLFLLGGIPLALPIARRSVPHEVSENEPFIRFNRLLSSIWMVSFFFSGLIILGMVMTGAHAVIPQIGVIILAVLIPMYIQRLLMRRTSTLMRSPGASRAHDALSAAAAPGVARPDPSPLEGQEGTASLQRSRQIAPPIQSMSDFIGATPLIRLRKLGNREDLEVYGKLELFNPAGSAKDRAARSLLQDAIATGRVHADSVIVESSSGNLGLALARACRLEGMRFLCVVDARTNRSAVTAMKAYGAEVEMVSEPDPDLGDLLATRRRRVSQFLDEVPGAVNLNQYANPANPRAHREGTMAEIAEALEGRVDELFVATSTTGTISGCASYCAQHSLGTRITAVDALGSVLFDGKAARRLIPGFGAGVEPPLAKDLHPDEVVRVDDVQTVAGCRRLALMEGLLLGGSSGAVAQAYLRREPFLAPGSKVVLLFHDGGMSYLETVYDDDWVRDELRVEPEKMRELALAPGPAPSVDEVG